MTTEHQIKTRIGRIVSDKMDKTVVVEVESRYKHPLYKKILRRTSKYKAHNENNEAKAGYTVRIIETRPLSKEKRWRVAEIISTGEIVQLPRQVTEAPPIEKIEPVVGDQSTEEVVAITESPVTETPPTAGETQAEQTKG
ncbi:MAG: ribosomal protein [Dehalococcoidia bacterium]|nr:ribosomal protein [Dehalococcoidia bacterium]